MEKRLIKGKVYLMIFIIIFGSLTLTSALTFNQTETNQTDDFNINESDYEDEGYSYEENLNDPKCYYNLNFCNIDYNVSSNSNSQGVINVLKYINYQMQDDLIYKDEQIKQKKNTIIFLIAIIVAVAIWNLYLTFRRPR